MNNEMDLIPVRIELMAMFIVLMALLFMRIRTFGTRGSDLPPGPKTTPILGNAADFPTSHPHIKFSQWAQQYGDIYSLKLLNRTAVILSSAAAVKEVLDSNGLSTGNRVYSTIIQRVTHGDLMPLEDMSNPSWKRGRKIIHGLILASSSGKHLEARDAEYSQFMRDILEDPSNTFEHICRTTAGVMMKLLYGSRVARYRGSDAETYFRSTKLTNMVADPGAFPPVDIIWPLQYVPKRWAYWKRLADTAREVRDGLYDSLYEKCERAVEHDRKTGCYVENLILNQEQLGMTRAETLGIAGTMMDTGAETTACDLQNLVLALINHPHVQERGQEEIDAVVGASRFPALDDYDRVPYVRAIVDELHRFRPVFPIALPHLSTKETHYRGYRIPENSIIFMNTYGISHDPDMYDDPETFDPERFLRSPFGTKEGVDVQGYRDNLAFGAGRRICPGEELARGSIAMHTMNLLWAFNLRKDGSGTGGIDVDSYSKLGIEFTPKPFTCDATPRSISKAQMIRERYEKYFPPKPNGSGASAEL